MKAHVVSGIAERRLHAQQLTGQPFASPVDAVRWLGAVQSQDYAGAKWALGQRSHGLTDAKFDRLFDEGAILRTHVMRPTWHFVAPEDIRWLLALTGHRVRLSLAARYRELELDEKQVGRAAAAFAAALAGGRQMTRPELGEVLRVAGISPEGQRLPHLLMSAELDALIVSGPRKGKQFTYALLDERVPKTPILDPGASLAELTRRYFCSHGPAQLQDLAWWSGLTMADSRRGIALAGGLLDHETIEGRDYWFGAEAGATASAAGLAHLLPNWDEYTVGYRDRAALLHADRPFDPAIFAFGSILANVVIVEGRVRASWRRTLSRAGVRVEIRVLDRFEDAEIAAVEVSGRRFSRFLEKPVELIWLS